MIFQGASMKIEFVNHASVILASGDVRLICDPWLETRVFNDGWELLSETALEYEDFADLTHIWFSHEHPDHFCPPNVRSIPPEARKNLQILFRESKDHRVVDYCSALDFGSIVELAPGEPRALADDFVVRCRRVGEDSWLLTEAEGHRVLNVNDCELYERAETEEIRREVGQVDVLLTQFSYASWSGDTTEEREASAKKVLERMKMQIEVFEPKYVIPFASFVWFCHQENFHLNDGANRIDTVEEYLRSETSAEPIVLYPGDSWTVGEDWDSRASVARYLVDWQKIDEMSPGDLSTGGGKTREELLEEVKSFREKTTRESNPLLLRAYLSTLSRERRTLLDRLLFRAEPCYVWVVDHEQAYRFSALDGLVEVEGGSQDCDLRLSSDSLWYALKFEWGGETLEVNGRYALAGRGRKWTFFNQFAPYRRKSHGYAPLRFGSLAQAALRKALGSSGGSAQSEA